MEYQKITNLLDNAPNQPFKLRTRKWVEINDGLRGTQKKKSIETTMRKSSLCEYSNAYILAKGTI